MSWLSKRRDLLFAAILGTLVALLWADRALHQKFVEPVQSLNDFLQGTNHTAFLQTLPTGHPLSRLIPSWATCRDPSVELLPELVGASYAFQNSPASAAFQTQASSFQEHLSKNYRPLPRLLSDAFVDLNRFIQTKTGFDHVDNSLDALLQKFKKQPLTVPPELLQSVEQMNLSLQRARCHWHQRDPWRENGWAFTHTAGPTGSFPLDANAVPNRGWLDAYFQRAAEESPYPLWYQAQKPARAIFENYDVRTQPKLGALDWVLTVETLREELSLHTTPRGQAIKTVAWQLRNLTALIDRAARLTPPEANQPFIETITQLNATLNRLPSDEPERWDALAWDIASHDLHHVDDLENLRKQPAFQLTPSSREELEKLWEKHFGPYFQQTAYWVYPKGNMELLTRIQAVEEALARDPSIILSPETPLAYWWIYGKELERSRTHFRYRQLIAGLLVGMTLLLWSLKKISSS